LACGDCGAGSGVAAIAKVLAGDGVRDLSYGLVEVG
jgi:hypothetical protein